MYECGMCRVRTACALWNVHLRASNMPLDEDSARPERRRGASDRRLPALPDRGHLAYRARGGRAHCGLAPHHVGIGVAPHERTLERGEL